jgi:hypothetical protein
MHEEMISRRLLGHGYLDIVARPVVVVTDCDPLCGIWGGERRSTARNGDGGSATNQASQNRPAVAGISQPPGERIERASIHR